MSVNGAAASERALILAPGGRDAQIAAQILAEASIASTVCDDLVALVEELEVGAGVALIVEEALHDQDYGRLAHWVEGQPAWSDFPILLLARRGAGVERNPSADRMSRALGNVTFLERPFHPTTLVSVVQTALRGRRRQYEARERLSTLRTAIIQQQSDQSRLRLMVNELNHRVKNTLATVQSIVAQTLRGEDVPAGVREALTSRVLALSHAHDVLTDEQWAGADLREIAIQAAAPYRDPGGSERFVLRGPALRLPPKTAIAVALAFHELATNAAKYGGLSTNSGRVELDWTVEGPPDARRLRIVWREIGGPVVKPPTRTGFGTRLIERGLAADLNGRVILTYPPDGVVCTIESQLTAPDEHLSTPFSPPPLSGVGETPRTWRASGERQPDRRVCD
jgi:two-component sensor histidine kinase